MRKLVILGAVALALAGCQGARGGYGQGSYEYEYGYRPNSGYVGGNWARDRDRDWRRDGYQDQQRWRNGRRNRPEAPNAGDP